MNSIRRAVATFSIVAILSSFVVSTASAATGHFKDVTEGQYWYNAIEQLAEDGVVDTTKDTFAPSGALTRGEAARYLVMEAGFELVDPATPYFTDVPKTHKYYKEIETAYAHGVVKGDSNAAGTPLKIYRPDATLNRAEFAKMSVAAFELPAHTPATATFTDVKDSKAWYYADVYTAAFHGVISGYAGTTLFKPANDVLKGEGAQMTYAALNVETGGGGEEPVVGAGDINVSVNDETPTGVTLPSGATSVPMATWDFTAGDTDATLKSIEIKRFGVWTLPSAHQVYLYDGLDRLTSGKSVNSTTNVVTFSNLNLAIEAGETKSLTLRLDVGDNSAGSSGELGFQLTNADAVDAGDGVVDGTFPAKGETFGVSTTAAGTITIEKNGTITNPQVGQKDVTIAKFKIGAATENASLEQLGLYVAGTVATADVQDFKLYVSGTTEPLATVDALNSKDVAAFVLDTPYDIAKGDTRSFWVTGSFNTGRTDDTVLAYIDESTDVVAIGDKYGFGMGVTMGSYDGVSCTAAGSYADCTNSTLEGGDITISGTAISNRNLAVNQDDVTVMKFTISAATDATFNNFVLTLDVGAETHADAGFWKDSDNSANFTDIKIKEVGGDHVWGPIDSDVLDSDTSGTNITDTTEGDGTLAYYIFTDDLVMEAGESKDFELSFDVANNANLANQTITPGIFINASYPEVKDVNNKILTNSSSIVPTSSYTADTFTVKANSLTVARGSAIGSATKVIGTNNVPLLALSIGSGDASATKITSITATGYIDDNGGGGAFVEAVDTVYFNEVVLGMNLYKGSVSEANKLNASAKAANTLGKVTFDNLSWTIPAGQTETLIITGNLANNASYDTDQFKIDIEDVSADIVAEDDKGNTVSSTSADGPNGEEVDSTILYTEITVSSGGTLTVDIPSNTPPAKVVVGGSTGNEMAKIKFTASRESFTLGKLALRNNYGSTVGDYDDNFGALKVKYYTDAAQTVEATTTCAAAAEEGYFTCSGMTMYVPDADLSGTPDYAILTVVGDFADVASDQADEGDLPEITLSLAYDFEATGIGSSTKITENGTTNSLAITDSVVASYAAATHAEGADLDATGADTVLAVHDETAYTPGDLVCIDDEDTGCDAADEIAYVVAVCSALDTPHADCTADNDIILIRGVNGEIGYAATTADDDIDRLVKTSVLDVNLMELRATNMTLTATASRTGSTNVTEAIMSITAVANAAKDVTLRQGSLMGVATVEIGGGTLSSESTPTVDGTAADKLILSAAGDAIVYDAGIGFDATYDRVSFWVYTDDAGAQAIALANWKISTHTAADAVGDNISALATASTTDNVWHFVDMALPTNAYDALDRYFIIEVDALGNLAAADFILIDQVRLYSEKINVDLTLNENWAAITPTLAYLKQNGEVKATGYVDYDDAVASKTGQIIFVPVSTYADIEINATDTFTVEMDTTTAITDDSAATEKLTAKIDLGAYGTAGDVYWYDGAGTTNYLGISATDSISTVTSY